MVVIFWQYLQWDCLTAQQQKHPLCNTSSKLMVSLNLGLSDEVVGPDMACTWCQEVATASGSSDRKQFLFNGFFVVTIVHTAITSVSVRLSLCLSLCLSVCLSPFLPLLRPWHVSISSRRPSQEKQFNGLQCGQCCHHHHTR